jgi:chromosome partitioning protein
MRVIALMNQKGGVGKTTTTVNLGAALAELGKNVCLMDLDPQAHLTINYGVDPTPEITSLYNVLVDGRELLDACMGIGKGISLVPSSIDLAAAEIELVSVLGREMLLKKRLEQAVADPSGDFDYDFVLLDCPPSLGLLTLNGLAVADEVLIPMQPHFLALQGVAKLLETVQLVNRRMNPNLKVAGIALTLFVSQKKLSNEVVAELKGFIDAAEGKNLPWSGAKLFKSKIRRNIKLAESPSFGQHIIQYDPGSNGANDYRALARELLGLPEPEPARPAAAAVPVANGTGSGDAAAPKPAKAARPRKPRAPKAAPAVEVSVNPAVDPSKLAAAKVGPAPQPRPTQPEPTRQPQRPEMPDEVRV